jgi:hypothetical protein
MKLSTALHYFGGEDALAQALRMPVRNIKRIEVDVYGQLLDLTLMDRILAAACRRRAAQLRALGQPIDALEADLTQI